MKKLVLAVTFALGAAVFAGPAAALPARGPATLPMASDVQRAQFIFGGRNYCWYDAGWHGPGFYWCGYAYRRGLGWGGGRGWQGWHHGRGGHVGIHRGRVGSPGIHRGRVGNVNRGGGRAGVRPGGGHGGGHRGHHR